MAIPVMAELLKSECVDEKCVSLKGESAHEAALSVKAKTWGCNASFRRIEGETLVPQPQDHVLTTN
jgi:hypothetical protein